MTITGNKTIKITGNSTISSKSKSKLRRTLTNGARDKLEQRKMFTFTLISDSEYSNDKGL